MKRNSYKLQKNWASRIGAFATILGLSLTALFTSVASADPVDTDPVISVDGTCDLWDIDNPGFNMSINNNDNWDESYGIAVFSGFYEDPEDLNEIVPDSVFEETVEANSFSGGQYLFDSIFATIQVVNIAENEAFGELVFHEAFLICAQNLPDFGFGEEDEESEDGPILIFDFMPQLLNEPQIPGFDFSLPDFEEEEESEEESEDGPSFNFDFMPQLPYEPQIPEIDFGIPDLGFGEGENEGNEDYDDEDTIEVDDNNTEEDGEEGPIQFENNDVEDDDHEEAPIQVNNNADDGQTVLETEHINESKTTKVVEALDTKITLADADNQNTGEIASVIEKVSQNSSGSFPFWIIPIVVGGIATVGLITRIIRKGS